MHTNNSFIVEKTRLLALRLSETEQIRIEMKSPFEVAYFHLCAFITRQQIRKENAINHSSVTGSIKLANEIHKFYNLS